MSNILDPKVVSKIAHLARLSNNPSEDFLEKNGRELGAILDYVAELKEVDISGVDNIIGSTRVVTIDDLAPDELDLKLDEYQKIRNNIIANFPNKQGDLLVLPGIFEN